MPEGLVRVGFVGLGVMGQAMALNLVRSGIPLTVWNRTPSRCTPVVAAGARAARDLDELFGECDVVQLMLADEPAVDDVLGRGTPRFRRRVAGRVVVHMGTVAPEFSRALEADIVSAGGAYVEAPVSGSRGPAESGELVVMLAGTEVAPVVPLLEPMCRASFRCGAVPGALLMKLAVNHFLVTMVTGLAEAFAFAERHGIDTTQLADILEVGPMASQVSRTKARKLATADFAVEASVVDVSKNARLIVDSARQHGATFPLIAACLKLYDDALGSGHGALDMAAVVTAMGR